MTKHYDLVIIGAGPGGIQLAISLQELSEQWGRTINYVLLEADMQVASFFRKYPIHGQLISNNKLFTGYPPTHPISERYDWNSLLTKDKKIMMRNYSTDFHPRREALVEMLQDIVKEYNLPIQYNTKCEMIEKKDGSFELITNEGILSSDYVVIASGLTPIKPEIPGLELATMYEDMKRKEYYRDKRVLIIGKGNSAMESAQDILNEANVIMLASPSSTRMAYKTHYVGHVRAVNSFLIENYQLKHQAALLDCNIVSIEKVENGFNVTLAYIHAEGEVETLFFHEVIAATGFKPNFEQFTKHLELRKMNGKFPSISGEFESTEVHNLFFAGAHTHGLDFRKTSSGFIHGFRYNSRILANVLTLRMGFPIDQRTIAEKDVVQTLLTVLTENPDIFLQPGLIAYILEYVNGQWNEIGYRTLPDFNKLSDGSDSYFIAVTLEYGDIDNYPDVLSIPRRPGNAADSTFLHPIIRIRNQNIDIKQDLEEVLEVNFMSEKYFNELTRILEEHCYATKSC